MVKFLISLFYIFYFFSPLNALTFKSDGSVIDSSGNLIKDSSKTNTSDIQVFNSSSISNFNQLLTSDSYRLQKPQDLISIYDPGMNSYEARIILDLNNDKIIDYFVATKIDFNKSDISTAIEGDFKILLGTESGSFRDRSSLIIDSVGCFHARQAFTSDFNQDGLPDIFVACTGPDIPPFPGEHSKVLLSQSDGTYKIVVATEQKGFYHGGSAADFNGDGFVDVVLANGRKLKFLYGNGDGTFFSDQSFDSKLKLQNINGPYYAVATIDINGDGRFDLILGGHEFSGAKTKYFLNNKDIGFEASETKIISTSDNRGGIALDFIAVDSKEGRELWVLRTSGGGDFFHEGNCLQRLNIETNKKDIPICRESKEWFPWLTTWTENNKTFIGPDDTKFNFVIDVNNPGLFELNQNLIDFEVKKTEVEMNNGGQTQDKQIAYKNVFKDAQGDLSSYFDLITLSSFYHGVWDKDEPNFNLGLDVYIYIGKNKPFSSMKNIQSNQCVLNAWSKKRDVKERNDKYRIRIEQFDGAKRVDFINYMQCIYSKLSKIDQENFEKFFENLTAVVRSSSDGNRILKLNDNYTLSDYWLKISKTTESRINLINGALKNNLFEDSKFEACIKILVSEDFFNPDYDDCKAYL